MDINSIIILAYKLTFLTFNLGVLIYALPVPWSSIKVWGPRLIGDSIAAFALLTLYYVLLEISNKIPLYLGGSWDYFGVWINNIVLFAASLKELVIVAYTAAKAAGISRAVSTILWPIDRLANVLWLFIISVYGFALLVKNYYYALIGLGMALYSLPFRIGRSAGAWLIAFGIVFNAGLPVLPVFVSWLYQADATQGSPITEYGLVYVSATIADSQGKVLDHGLLKVRILTGEGLTLVGSYPVVEGKAYTVNNLDYIPIPSRIDSYMYLELAGVVFALAPYPLKPSQIEAATGGYSIDLKAKHIIWHKADLIVFTNTLNYRILEEESSSILVEVNLTREGYVEVRAPKGCDYSIE
ncbi:MAG: hypothetical protein F7B95_03820, partial [Desulfurococcales archaeon]|nr:hypothetical protein [Desulfurococcales archaeon]